MKRVLIISYAFPPVGGAGVQRAVKFTKYLPAQGWEVSVLTVANPSVPVMDQSLGSDVPPQTLIRRARTLEPGYAAKTAVSAARGSTKRGGLRSLVRNTANFLLQPDAQILWLPGALKEGKRMLAQTEHHAIIATGPPFSSFLVGKSLARSSKLPLVLDYRDEWDLSSAYLENRKPGRLSLLMQQRMQRSVVRQARMLVATTRHSAGSLERVRDAAKSKAVVTWIYNGFDPDDFIHPPKPDPQRNGRWRLAYVGTLWNLTDVAPLVEAVKRLAQRDPAAAARLELVFAGRRTGSQQEILNGLAGLPCKVTEHPYVHHDGAIDLIRAADGLCLLLADVPGAGRVVPAKLFEYMAAGRPMVAIAPPGEVWDLLSGRPDAHLLAPGDVDGICSCLAQQLQAHVGHAEPRDPSPTDALYDRKNQAGQLARLLDSMIA